MGDFSRSTSPQLPVLIRVSDFLLLAFNLVVVLLKYSRSSWWVVFVDLPDVCIATEAAYGISFPRGVDSLLGQAQSSSLCLSLSLLF